MLVLFNLQFYRPKPVVMKKIVIGMKFCSFGKNQFLLCENTFCVFHFTRGKNCVNDNVGGDAVYHIAYSLTFRLSSTDALSAGRALSR